MLHSKFTGQALFKFFIEFLRENTGKAFIIEDSGTYNHWLMNFMLTMTDVRFLLPIEDIARFGRSLSKIKP